jgi:hypothetical protein
LTVIPVCLFASKWIEHNCPSCSHYIYTTRVTENHENSETMFPVSWIRIQHDPVVMQLTDKLHTRASRCHTISVSCLQRHDVYLDSSLAVTSWWRHIGHSLPSSNNATASRRLWMCDAVICNEADRDADQLPWSSFHGSAPTEKGQHPLGFENSTGTKNLEASESVAFYKIQKNSVKFEKIQSKCI